MDEPLVLPVGQALIALELNDRSITFVELNLE